MKVEHWFKDKWVNRVQQFGLRAAISQMARAAVRPVWQVKRDLILAIIKHQPDAQPKNLEVSDMTAHAVEAASERGELNERQRSLLLGFLAEGCRGFLAEIKGSLAGYAFVQPSGTYVFGGSGRLQIPSGTMMLKNLLVFPQFRGYSLGKKLNQARIASIPADQTPIVFVITENRFAIRNLKMCDFEEVLIVTRTMWFKRWTKQRVCIVTDCEITHRVISWLESTPKIMQKMEGGSS